MNSTMNKTCRKKVSFIVGLGIQCECTNEELYRLKKHVKLTIFSFEFVTYMKPTLLIAIHYSDTSVYS